MNTINAQTIINEVMQAHAVAPMRELADYFDKIKFQTSTKGFHSIHNSKENLQRFADRVRKNAALFGGGLIREAKPRPAVSWPSNLISLFKQSIEDRDYQAALDIGDKLGALFFVTGEGVTMMQVAPVPCDFEPRLSSVCQQDGTYSVIFPQNMTSLSGFSYKAKRARDSQIDNVKKSLNARTNFSLSQALDKQPYTPVDQVAARAQWIMEHGLSAESIESRIVAHESESIEALATQDVAQVVAQAVAAVAISEAMKASEERELVTCEAGENEAQGVTVGSTTGHAPAWASIPPSGGKQGATPPAEIRATTPTMEFLGEATPRPAVSDEALSPTAAEFLIAMATAYEKRLPVRIEKIKVGECFQFSKSGEVYLKCRDGYRSGRGGALLPKPPGALVFFHDPSSSLTDQEHKDSGLRNFSQITPAPTPPAVESTEQAMAPVVETEATPIRTLKEIGEKWDADMVEAKLQIEAMKAEREASRLEREAVKQAQDVPDTLESFSEDGDGVSQDLCDAVDAATVAQVQALTNAQFSKLYDHLENWNFHSENYFLQALRTGDAGLIQEMREIAVEHKKVGGMGWALYDRAKAASDAVSARFEELKPLMNLADKAKTAGQNGDYEGYQSAIRAICDYKPNQLTAPAECAQVAINTVAINPPEVPATAELEKPQGQQVKSKSSKWSAYLYTWHDGKPWMNFEATNGAYDCQGYETASERMQALQAMARAADAPTDTPPTGGLPSPAESSPSAPTPPVAASTQDTPVAVSGAADAPRHPRNIVPDNGLHVVEDSFEAWTFTSGARFSFVMYLGKSAKPWKYYGYSTEAKRDDGFNRHAQEARSIGLSKANRKAESKSQAEKPHGLQVGDVVRSSWGYDQTNVNHYQIIKVIGKRTVEVRKLAEHEQSTGDMSGRVAPVHGEFVGEVMRRQVDRSGQVNILQAAYGRASKIEPLAIVHGVRCYSATNYSSWA